ncbi:SUMF1/EgtB/PvdO family nonheme iron enzyme [bacterium]|nr:SUMF1/EgtB/PvdO family nonheme iron enzyme [bacterium]
MWGRHAGPAGSADPQGPSSPGSSRVYRGGGWSDAPLSCRSAIRLWNAPGSRFSFLGFRVLRSSVLK